MIEPEVVMNGFNDLDALKRLVESLLDAGVPKEKIHYFDGPFEYFPAEFVYSTDGTLEYLNKLGIEVIPCGRMSHMDKQNTRFRWLENKEAIFHFDCDEYVIGDWDKFCEVLTKTKEIQDRVSYNVPWTDINKQYTGVLLRGRLFFDLANLKVEGKHWHFYHHGRLLDPSKAPAVGGLHIFHDSSIRTDKREAQMKEFQEKYTPVEESEYCKANYIELPPNQVQCHPCGCTIGYVYYIDPEPKPTKKCRQINVICSTHKQSEVEPCPFCHSPEPRRCSKCNNKI